MKQTAATIDSEIYDMVSRRIASHITATERNAILMEELMHKLSEDEHLDITIHTPWVILQIKNEMIKNGLLYVTFDKPLQQLIGLSLRGKAIF